MKNKYSLLKKRIFTLFLCLLVIVSMLTSIYVFIIYKNDYKKIIASGGHYHSFLVSSLPVWFKAEIKYPETNKSKETIDPLIKTDEEIGALKKTETNKVSILLANIGNNNRIRNIAFQLPHEIGIGLLPHTDGIEGVISEAHTKGFDIYAYIPLELNSQVGGTLNNLTLLTSLKNEDNIKRLRRALSYFGNNYQGIYVSPDETYSKSASLLKDLVLFLEQNHLKCVWAKKTTSDSLLMSNSISIADIVILADIEEKEMQGQLKSLVEKAKEQGHALVYINTSLLNISVLRQWLMTLQDNDVELTSVDNYLNFMGEDE